ncbi:MAG: hypothetical protein EOP04_11400 [Proteobacteria bacterium]|nr:MAG: hypothetical protein EOP04_11400 [Pseudomonadota bacterium]
MKSLFYYGLGFPVFLKDVETEVIRSEELPIVDHNELERRVFSALLRSDHQLTGAEFSFARGFMRKTQKALASSIGLKTHSMISTWEAKGNASTGMDPAQEHAVRTVMAHYVNELNSYLPTSLAILRGEFSPESKLEVSYKAA